MLLTRSASIHLHLELTAHLCWFAFLFVLASIKCKHHVDGFSIEARFAKFGFGYPGITAASFCAERISVPLCHNHHIGVRDLTVVLKAVQHPHHVEDDTVHINKTDDFIKLEIEAQNTNSIVPTVEETTAFSGSDADRYTTVIKTDVATATSGKDSSSQTKLSKRRDPRPFPLSMIIDQQEIKRALLLAAVRPRSISVIISGGRGTGKSVLARSIQRIVPSHIRRIKHSEYNIDPEGIDGIDSFLIDQLNNGEKTLKNLETELITAPFVQIPLGVMEDSLIGTVDLEQSLEIGSTVFSPGLLAKAHRGILYVDEINLLDDEVADILLKVLSDGYVTVEREGLSVRYPCRPLMIGTFNPQEGELREHLLDRFAIALSADATPLSVQERVMGVDNVIGFSGGTQVQSTSEAEENLRRAEAEEQNLRTKVEMARARLQEGVDITTSQIRYLCEEATRGGCEGQRAEIFATEIAKASAALEGRTAVNANDLRTAVILAILPRATIPPGEVITEEDQGYVSSASSPPPPPSSELSPIMEPPPPTVMNGEEQEEIEEDRDEEDKEKTPEEMEEDTEDKEEQEEEKESNGEESLAIPEQFMFGVKSVKLDPTLLKFSRWTRQGKGGKRAKIFSLLRGRFVKAIFPKGRKSRLAVGKRIVCWVYYQRFNVHTHTLVSIASFFPHQ